MAIAIAHLKWGTYTVPRVVRISPSEEIRRADDGDKLAKHVIWEIEGMLLAANAAALQALIVTHQTAFASDGQDALFEYPDNSDTDLFIDSSETLTGTRITRLPEVQGSGGPATYITQWPYSLIIEAMYDISGGNETVSFSETLDISSGPGGKRLVSKTPIEGASRVFRTATAKEFRAVQSGTIIAWTDWKAPPSALFASAYQNGNVEVSKSGPHEHYPSDVHRMYQTDWTYHFVAETDVFSATDPNDWV